MSTELTVQSPRKSVLVDMASRYGMEPQTFHATVMATCMPSNTRVSNEQFAAFLLVAKEYGLNPLTKEIYAFPSKGGIQPMVSIDGWSNIINSHPKFDGMEFSDHLDEKGELVAITCRMHRTDRKHPTEATEYLAECRRQTEPWQKWPRRMLRHKAMIQAARYAFGFSGIYDPDEAERIAGDSDRSSGQPRPTLTAALDRLAAPSPAAIRGANSERAEADEIIANDGTVLKSRAVGVDDIQPDDTSADEAGPEETASTSEGATAGADDGPAAPSGDDFPGDQPATSGQPDFEAMIERFKVNAPQAETIEELENAADELLPHMDGEALSRTQRELVQGIWEDNRKRIVNRAPKAAAKKTGQVDANDPDYKKGWSDAERGATKCLKQEIRDNPDRLATWKAGFDAFHAQAAEG